MAATWVPYLEPLEAEEREEEEEETERLRAWRRLSDTSRLRPLSLLCPSPPDINMHYLDAFGTVGIKAMSHFPSIKTYIATC